MEGLSTKERPHSLANATIRKKRFLCAPAGQPDSPGPEALGGGKALTIIQKYERVSVSSGEGVQMAIL